MAATSADTRRIPGACDGEGETGAAYRCATNRATAAFPAAPWSSCTDARLSGATGSAAASVDTEGAGSWDGAGRSLVRSAAPRSPRAVHTMNARVTPAPVLRHKRASNEAGRRGRKGCPFGSPVRAALSVIKVESPVRPKSCARQGRSPEDFLPYLMVEGGVACRRTCPRASTSKRWSPGRGPSRGSGPRLPRSSGSLARVHCTSRRRSATGRSSRACSATSPRERISPAPSTASSRTAAASATSSVSAHRTPPPRTSPPS
ncbi:hypothetical protein SCOCK_190052 [Actinacidiphila cocklensis]|uniref:Uncharacterized protein n=1 Tax=Actinacidiphila cocklensis TaxID=887465 RepID=A0A9W4DNK7_9ACTN|nr:hypothetical protein SCOCK_190052 [Actinacidiphila cocklensis]